LKGLLANIAFFHLGWLGCVAGAGRGLYWLGPALGLALVARHIASASERRAEVRLIALAMALGVVADSALAALHFVTYAGASWPPFAPAWIVVLWALFATTLRHALGFLHGRWALAALLGSVSGPLSYLAGERLGAVSLGVHGLPALAVAWGLALPILLWASQSRTLRAHACPVGNRPGRS